MERTVLLENFPKSVLKSRTKGTNGCSGTFDYAIRVPPINSSYMSHAHYGSEMKGLKLAPTHEYRGERSFDEDFEVTHSQSVACVAVGPCLKAQETRRGRPSYG